jgi:hypothetical protein
VQVGLKSLYATVDPRQRGQRDRGSARQAREYLH